MTFPKSIWTCACAVLLVSAPLAEAADSSSHWSLALRQQLDRIGQVDWKLATLAPQRCPHTVAGTGLVMDSLTAYDKNDRVAVATALGMGAYPQIASVAVNSPADRAGLSAGDDILALNRVPVADLLVPESKTPIAVQFELLLEGLPVDQAALVTVESEGDLIDIWIEPVARCGIRTVLIVDDAVEAYSDQEAIALTTGLLFFTQNDHELALVAGHELAHVILREQLSHDNIDGKWKEDAADQLGAELATCAGYDMRLAKDFWLRFDTTQIFSFLPSFTHRSSKKRHRKLAEYVGQIDCAQAFPELTA